LSAISSNASDYMRSPRQSKGEIINLPDKSNFNNTVNLKLKGINNKEN